MPSVSKKQQGFMGALKLRLPINSSFIEYSHLLLNVLSKIMKPIGVAVSLSTTLTLSLFLFLSEVKNNICLWRFKSQVGFNFFQQSNTTGTRPFETVGLGRSSLEITRVITHLAIASINYVLDSVQKFLFGQCNPYVVFPRLIAFLANGDSFAVKANSSLSVNNTSNIRRLFNVHIYSIPQRTHKVKEDLYVTC